MTAIRNPFFLDSGAALNTVQSQEDPDFLAPKGQAGIPEGPRPSALRGVAPEPVQVAAAPMWRFSGQETATDVPSAPMWRATPTPADQAPVAPPPGSDGNLLTDTGNLLKAGVNSTTQNFRELVRNVPVVGESIVRGVDSIDQAISGRSSEEILKGNVEEARRNLTPETRAAEEKKWWDSEKGTFGDAWTDPRAYLSGVVQSAPEQLVTMIPAMRIAKFAYAGKVAAGASAEVASASAARAATLAGGILEGSMAGAASSREVREKILGMGQDQLKDSEALRSLIASGMDFDEARRQIANDAASQAFITSGVVTGMFGGFGDRALAKIVTEKAGAGILKRFGRAAVAEGALEEFPQEIGSAVAENVALQRADPKIGAFDDALNRGLGGLATGGLQGGVMGAASRGRRDTPAAQPPRPEGAGDEFSPSDMPGGPKRDSSSGVGTGSGTGEGFFLPKMDLLREMNERPEFIAALYDSAEPADRPNILKAIDRLDKRDLFNQILSDGDMMQKGRDLVVQDEDNADFFRRSLLKLADTRPTGGNVKMPPRNVTQRDAEAIDNDLLNDDGYWQSLGAAPTKKGGFSALENTIAQTIQSAGDIDYLGRVGQRIAQRIADIQPDSLLKLRELYAQKKQSLEASKPPQGGGTPPGGTPGTPNDSAKTLEGLAVPGTPIDYDQYKFSTPKIKNGFMALGLDPARVMATGKRGVYTDADLFRASTALNALNSAQQNAKGVPNVRLSKRISLKRGDADTEQSVSSGPVKLTGTSPYLAKDQKKADIATKFIGRGSASSSTAGYAKNFGDRANAGVYSSEDVVFVSAEGNRQGRVDPDFAEIKRAIDARATIVTDDAANRNRPYNIGERQVAEFLTSNGYRESEPGRWSAPSLKRPNILANFKRSFDALSNEVYRLLEAAEDNGVNYDPGNKISQALDGAAFALEETGDLKFAADLILDADAALRPRDEALALRLYELGERMRVVAGGTTPSKLGSFEIGAGQSDAASRVKSAASVRDGKTGVGQQWRSPESMEPERPSKATPPTDAPSARPFETSWDGETEDVADALAPLVKPKEAKPEADEKSEAPRQPVAKPSKKAAPTLDERIKAVVGLPIPESMGDRAKALVAEGKIAEAEALVESLERIRKAYMDDVVPLKNEKDIGQDGITISNLLDDNKLAEAEAIVDKAYAKKNAPDKAAAKRVDPSIKGKVSSTRARLDALVERLKLPSVVMDAESGMTTEDAMQEIDALRLAGTKSSVESANELLDRVAQVRHRQILNAAASKKATVEQRLKLKNLADKMFKDLGLADFKGKDPSTFREGKGSKPKAYDRRMASAVFEDNYNGSDRSNKDFKRLVDLLVGQYLKMEPISNDPDEMTGVSREFFDSIGAELDEKKEKTEKNLVLDMLETLTGDKFRELVKATGKERKKVVVKPEEKRLQKFKAAVERVTRRLDAALMFVDKETGEILSFEAAPMRKALEQAHARLDNIYASINANGITDIEKNHKGKTTFYEDMTRVNEDTGGVVNQMEFPSGEGERAGEGRMVEITSSNERRIKALLEEAKEVKDSIVMLQRGLNRELARRFRERSVEIQNEVMRLSEEAIAEGASSTEVAKIRDEIITSIAVLRSDDRKAARPTAKKEEVDLPDQEPIVGLMAAKSLVNDYLDKKIDFNEAVAVAREQIKDKEYTLDDLIAEFRRGVGDRVSRGVIKPSKQRDVDTELVSALLPIASRQRMADYVRRHGGGYVHRVAWLTSLDKALRAEKAGGWNTKLFSSLTDAEKSLYGQWREKKTDIALRRDDRNSTSALSDDVENAFPELLFVRFPLDGMRDFNKIKRDSDRLNVISIFGDPSTAYDAWMGDIDYALSKRPDMAQNIKAYLPEYEANAYRAWKRQKLDAIALRARMIDQSKFYLAAHKLVPLPDDPSYNELYKDDDERKAAVNRAKNWWKQFALANESERLALLDQQVIIQEGVRVPLSDTVSEEQAERILEEIKEREETTRKIASYDNLAGRGPGAADYTLENTADESSSELLNSGEASIEDIFGNTILDDANRVDPSDREAGGTDDDSFGDSGPRLARGRYTGVVAAANVQIEVARITSKWKAAPEVIVLQNASQLDEPLRSAVLEKAGENSDAKGLFITDEGTVYLFSDHIVSESDVQWTLFHESYGHFGMRLFLGKSFDSFLDNVYKTREDIRRKADERSQEEGIGRLEAVEEILADSAGDAKSVGLFKQMTGKLIQWLRNNGFTSVANYLATRTDAEVAYVLKSARNAVQNGGPAPYRGSPAELRLAEQARIPYELFSLNNGRTMAYARFDPTRDVWYVFNAIGGNPDNYNVQQMQNLNDVRSFMRRFGKVEARVRSGLYVEDKLLPDLIHTIPDYRDNPSRIKRALNWLQLQVQNEYLPVWKVVDFLSKNGTVTDAIDLRKDLSGLYERETAALLEDFRRNTVDKLKGFVADAKALGVSDEFINLYAVARHAQERNRQVSSVNPSIQYGSGMPPRTADRKGYLDVLEDARSRGWDVPLEKVGRLTDQMSRDKTAYEVHTGLISAKEAQKRMGAYQRYVNLSGVNGDMDKFDDPMSMVSGRRFNVKGKDKRAMGRSDVAPDVLARTIASFEASIIRGQKNLVAQRLLGLMELNYDPNFVSINKVATKRSIVDGMVQEVEDENYIGRKDVMVAKVKGIPVTMEFKQTGKNSFAEAIHGVVYPPDSNAALYWIGQIQNRIGRLLTTWNPVWVAINYMRDVQALTFNAAVDKRIGTAQAAKMVKRTLPAGRVAMYVALQDYHPTTPQGKAAKATFAKMVGQPDQNMINWYKEARAEGALTSFIDRKGLEEQIQALDSAMHGQTAWDRVQGVGAFMELLTIPMEMGPRLAAYATMREAGWTRRDAAVLAGEITVNFNMRGKAAWLRQLYLFFNPAVQGTAKIVSLAKNDPARFVAASFAFAGLGAMVGLIGRMFSGDDEDKVNKLDKIPDFKRATSMVLKADMPGAAIPIPYGWNSFYALGTFLTDYVAGAQTLKTTAGRIFKATWESSLPIGSSGLESKGGPVVTVAKMASPTLVLPFVEYAVNENRYGAPIYKKGFPGQPPAPAAYSAFRSVSPISRILAEGANNLTGGTRTSEGAVSVNPAFVDHMINAFLPGIPAETYKLASMGVRVARGEELKNTPIPVLDRFTAKVSESWDSSAYMRVKELVDAKWRDYENAPSEKVREQLRVDFKGLAEAKNITSSVDSQIRKLEANYNKMLVAMDRGQIPESRVVEIRNDYDRAKKNLYKQAIGAALSIKEGDDRPIREALLGG